VAPATTATATSTGGGLSLVAKAILAVAAVLVLLAIAPPRAAYALGPRVGETFAHGRLALAGIGVAMAVGMLVALGLGGTQ
jgi:hypothetical protein